jgi:restriction system protein
MKKLTIYGAIKEALKREGKPLRIKEIYNRIIEDDLYQFNSNDPEHIVRTMTRRHTENHNFPSASKTKYFTFLKDGRYWLKDVALDNLKESEKLKNEESIVYDQLESLHKKYISSFKTSLLNQLKELDPYSFEFFCRKLLITYGFNNVKVTKKSRDGGIDGYGELKVGLAKMNVAFECKKWKGNRIPRKIISQFRGDIQGKYQQGIFFTTSEFSKDAESVSFQPGAVPIILIDGLGIVNIMIEKQFGIEIKELPIYTDAIDLILPENQK